MPAPTRQLTLDAARALIATCGFGPEGPTGPTSPHADSHRTVGVELESFLRPPVPPERLPAVALAAGSRLTFEPGGQVELSSPPQMTVAAACDALGTDLAALGEAFSQVGVVLTQGGQAPVLAGRLGLPERVVDAPRYRAMEAYFDRRWPEAGRTMMCATASVQVNLGLGRGERAARRWRAANSLGPVLAAAFSSSGRGSRRMANWLALDPSRTAPVPRAEYRTGVPRHGQTPAHTHSHRHRNGSSHRRAWADYALAGHVMLIRTDDGHVPVLDDVTLRAWIEDGHPLGWPTGEDVAYHLTTLFPPVRPRGWLELRMIDALPDPWWRVPVAVAAALIDDRSAVLAAETVADRWSEAATDGLADPPLAAVAAVCARRAVAGLHRVGVDVPTALMVEQWAATVGKGCEPPWPQA